MVALDVIYAYAVTAMMMAACGGSAGARPADAAGAAHDGSAATGVDGVGTGANPGVGAVPDAASVIDAGVGPSLMPDTGEDTPSPVDIGSDDLAPSGLNPDAVADARAEGGSEAVVGDASALADHGAGDSGSSTATCSMCASYGTPMTLGRVTLAGLNNMSGMGVSRRNPGVLYVHNDLTRAEFFALSESAALLATFTFPATTVVDMEDMAVGHCPAGSCVYLADTGDNNVTRTSYAIVRTPEPEVVASTQAPAAPPTTTVLAEKLSFSFPDGSHNTESLLVDPGSDTLYVITKVTSIPSTVYRLPAIFGGPPMVAQKVLTLTVPTPADGPATGASAQPCGAGFLLRTNTILYEFRLPAGAPFEAAFSVAPVSVPLAVETKGEAVAYRLDGAGYFTTGEGTMQPISQVGCR